jgi:hypothetical protein
MRSSAPDPLAGPRSESPHDRMVQALLAGEGFRRVAAIASELTGAEVEVLVPRPGSDGSGGSETERFAAALVAGRLPPWPAGVTEVAPIVVDGEPQGAVVARGELGPDGAEHLRSAARAALTGIAILNTRDQVRRDAAAGLIADLLAGRRLAAPDITRRAGLLGCDLRQGFVAVSAGGPRDGGHEEIRAALAGVHPRALIEAVDGTTYALVPGTSLDTKALAARLGDRVARAHSFPYEDSGQARQALDEARTLLILCRRAELRHTDLPTWDNVRIIYGAYVSQPARLREFCQRTVGELVRQDADEDDRLQATFWTYQNANCNMNAAAARLDTHRHTVANRLRRIRQLTGLDPQRGYDRELLGLALRTHLVIVNSGGGGAGEILGGEWALLGSNQ